MPVRWMDVLTNTDLNTFEMLKLLCEKKILKLSIISILWKNESEKEKVFVDYTFLLCFPEWEV